MHHRSSIGSKPPVFKLGHYHLLGGVDAGGTGVAAGLFGDVGRLRDDQPALAGALAVVPGVQGGRRVAGPAGAQPGQRRHDDAVGEGEGAEPGRLEQGIVHGGAPSRGSASQGERRCCPEICAGGASLIMGRFRTILYRKP